ncbi:helix-turn-helix transcriptional regulator [Actinomadura algeriensis]|uniref:DNA-binding NarL/FixJ family response regulator n=1 Tax=Actinomadura algeriensis TaxID=1679523 RepID=A0ABR9K3M4_9ACTN|nr:response regulator transcription factor [Actinomadura algeriensis]MBE1537459.1 DNA-binding NarL/FixJ family response regulator [Actinomadura algeriensis]
MSVDTVPSTDLNVTLRGEAELLERAGHLFAAREEFACAARDLDTWALPGFRERLVAERRALRHAPAVRKLFNPEALATEASERHLLDVSRAGVDVRICTAPLPYETIVVDRRIAILAGPRRAGDREFTVVRSPGVVRGVVTLLQAAWDRSADLADHRRDRAPALTDESRRILRMLADGRKDEAAARRLGMSLRTYRRRVAEILVLLDAESRFQAGLRAHELGLLA